MSVLSEDNKFSCQLNFDTVHDHSQDYTVDLWRGLVYWDVKDVQLNCVVLIVIHSQTVAKPLVAKVILMNC